MVQSLNIELKNGENLSLEVTPLLLEYIEDYNGGVEQFEKDATGQKDENGYTKTMYATNQLLYAIIASNYNTHLTYRQAVRLVKLEDIDRIISFIVKNIPSDFNRNMQTNIERHRM